MCNISGQVCDLLRSFPYFGSAHRVLILSVLRSRSSSRCTLVSFIYFLLPSLHLSISLPIYRCPHTSISVSVFLSLGVHPLPCSHYYIFRCPPTSMFSLLHILQSFSPHDLTASVSLLLFLPDLLNPLYSHVCDGSDCVFGLFLVF